MGFFSHGLGRGLLAATTLGSSEAVRAVAPGLYNSTIGDGSSGAPTAGALPYMSAQNDLIKRLQDRATGVAPSLAEAQTNKNINMAYHNQLSALNTDNGMNAAQRAMLAGQAGQQAQTDIAQQGTMARLAERDNADNAIGSQILGAQGQQQQSNQLDAANYNASQARNTQLISGIGSAATTAAVMASDKNAKENISNSDGSASDFLDHLKGKLYEYKDSANGEGKHVGIMAQDLEKSALGKSMVFEEGGIKKVDFGKGFGALLAATTEINDKLKALEAKRG